MTARRLGVALTPMETRRESIVATLNEISDGRAILGLGTSSRALAEGLHDIAFERPAYQLRELASEVRSILAGDSVSIDHTRQARALRPGLAAAPKLPIWIAATVGLTTRIVADHADGWCPLFLTLERMRERAAELRQLRSGRAPLTITAGAFPAAAVRRSTRNILASSLARYRLAGAMIAA